MKKSALVLGVFSALALASCEKKTTTTVNEDGGTTTVEKVGLDEEKIDSTATNIKEGAKEAAQKTGDALEDVGEKIKEGADKAGEAIKEGAEDAPLNRKK